jgi:hypothetical protein
MYPIHMFDRALGFVMGRPSRFLEELDERVLPSAMLREEEGGLVYPVLSLQ